jgi:hypothetical protein
MEEDLGGFKYPELSYQETMPPLPDASFRPPSRYPPESASVKLETRETRCWTKPPRVPFFRIAYTEHLSMVVVTLPTPPELEHQMSR